MTTPKPFAQTPGRDTSQDREPPFDVARYYYDHRRDIADDLPILRRLMAAVDNPDAFSPAQWTEWYSVALGFAPDLIIELGRGRGNSTAVFGQAARRLRGRSKRTSIVSLCRTGDWTAIVAPRIAGVVGNDWFSSIDARMIDILEADYGEIIGSHQRVLVAWDAHGFEIAELVLGDILPRLAGLDHLVLIHDISDNRHVPIERSYGGHPLWKGLDWQARTGARGSRTNIGWMNSQQDQVIALGDFAARNDLEIGSADHEYARFFGAHPEKLEEMRRLVGDDCFPLPAHWAFLSLSGKAGPFHFPATSGARAATHRSQIVLDQAPRLPATIHTEPTPWAYASKLDWRPAAEPPAGAQAWIRCRVRVEGGAIGVSLLTPDERAFVGQRGLSGGQTADVILPAPAPPDRGRLVIHTWDTPVAARVTIDDLSLVW
jgi:hypothetical protein